MITIVHHPEDAKRLGDLLVERFRSDVWTSFRAAIAFAKRSGVKHIVKDLRTFAGRATVMISIGIDHCGTSAEAIDALLAAVQPNGEVWLFHNEDSNNPTFHPKLYLFESAASAECFIGSGNLTEGGLFTNYEAFVHLSLDRKNAEDSALLGRIESLLDAWSDGAKGIALPVTEGLIAELKASGDLPTEAEINARTKAVTNKAKPSGASVKVKKVFAAVRVPAAPRVVSEVVTAKKGRPSTAIPAQSSAAALTEVTGFVITLQNTDVGVGQKTKGTAKRGPELFIPKICVHANPEFWGWPKLFKSDPTYDGPTDRDGFTKMDRREVRMRLGSETLSVHWWYNPKKKDYRLLSERLRSAGSIGDILRIELADSKSGLDYYVEIIPKGASDFAKYAALCTEAVRNSPKKYGYYQRLRK